MNSSSMVNILVPREAEVLEYAQVAAARGLHFITDSKDSLLSPVVLPGWFKVGVKIKPVERAAA